MFAWGKSYKERFFALSVCVHCCRPCANRCRGFRQENISDGLGRCDLLGRLAISYGRWSNRDAQDERNALDRGFYLPQFFPRLVFDHVGLRKSKYELLVRKRVNCSRLAAIRAHRISVGQRVDGKICSTEKSRGIGVAQSINVNNLKVNIQIWAVVVAQLVERLLPISEVRGSNPVIGKNLYLY